MLSINRTSSNPEAQPNQLAEQHQPQCRQRTTDQVSCRLPGSAEDVRAHPLQLAKPEVLGVEKAVIADGTVGRGAGAALVGLGTMTIGAGFIGTFVDGDNRSTQNEWIVGFLGSFGSVGGLLLGAGLAKYASAGQTVIDRGAQVGKSATLAALGAALIGAGFIGAGLGRDSNTPDEWTAGFLGSFCPVGGALLGAAVQRMSAGTGASRRDQSVTETRSQTEPNSLHRQKQS